MEGNTLICVLTSMTNPGVVTLPSTPTQTHTHTHTQLYTDPHPLTYIATKEKTIFVRPFKEEVKNV